MEGNREDSREEERQRIDEQKQWGGRVKGEMERSRDQEYEERVNSDRHGKDI